MKGYLKEYFKLLRFVKPYKGLFCAATVCMIFSAIFDGVSLAMIVPLADKVLTNKKIIVPAKLPAFLSSLVDKVNSVDPTVLMGWMAVGILILFFLKGLFGFLQTYLMSAVGQKVITDIRAKLYAKLQTLSIDYFTAKRGGELVSRITNDVKLVENAVSYGSTDLVYQSAQVVLFLFLVFFIYWKLALITIVLMPLISLPIVRVGKILRKLSTKSQEKIADVNTLLYETISGVRIVKAFNMEDYEIQRFNRVNRDYYKLTMKAIKRTLIVGPFTEFIGCLAGVFVFVWGGKEVIAGRLSFGVFGLFLGSLFSLVRPFKKLSQVNSLNEQAVAAGTRIYEVLDVAPSVVDRNDADQLQNFRESVSFENVCSSYGTHEVLKNINLKVKKGEILAIVGPSGVGKSTLADLIPRFYDPKSGRILIDGVDIRDYTVKSLRQQIAIVTQEIILFNDTIRANISYGSLSATQEAIEQAAKEAYAHDFIMKLPHGYDTMIGDRGTKLSGGERQRIAIARALLKNPPILILDEATSQLDTSSERIVQEALDRLIKGRTVFIIAHRLSTVKNAHRIIVLDKGFIVEEGSHSELLGKDGLYKKLYLMQEIQK